MTPRVSGFDGISTVSTPGSPCRETTLILINDAELGYYLKYFDPEGKEWLSLGNRDRLWEVVCPDDWEASVVSAPFRAGDTALGGDDRTAACMGDGRSFDHAETGIEAVQPELAHGHVGGRTQRRNTTGAKCG